jgi:hypothetical protein
MHVPHHASDMIKILIIGTVYVKYIYNLLDKYL